MTIRPARREELMEAAAFLNESWRRAYRHILHAEVLAALSDEDRHARLLAQYDSGTSPLLLHDGGELLGLCRFGASQTKGYPDDGELTAIYVREDAIGKGYGHALFVRAEQALRAQGYERLVLDVLSQNTRAIAFYRAHGFAKVGQRLFRNDGHSYPLDIMRKSL